MLCAGDINVPNVVSYTKYKQPLLDVTLAPYARNLPLFLTCLCERSCLTIPDKESVRVMHTDKELMLDIRRLDVCISETRCCNHKNR